MAMSRKHYQQVADVLWAVNALIIGRPDMPAREATDQITRCLAQIFADDNPNFDRSRFYNAAGYPNSPRLF